MVGYSDEMGVLQSRHFPRNQNHASTGTLSYGRTGLPQCGQWLPGDTTLRPSGRRPITTFKNDPTIVPKIKANTANTTNGFMFTILSTNL